MHPAAQQRIQSDTAQSRAPALAGCLGASQLAAAGRTAGGLGRAADARAVGRPRRADAVSCQACESRLAGWFKANSNLRAMLWKKEPPSRCSFRSPTKHSSSRPKKSSRLRSRSSRRLKANSSTRRHFFENFASSLGCTASRQAHASCCCRDSAGVGVVAGQSSCRSFGARR